MTALAPARGEGGDLAISTGGDDFDIIGGPLESEFAPEPVWPSLLNPTLIGFSALTWMKPT